MKPLRAALVLFFLVAPATARCQEENQADGVTVSFMLGGSASFPLSESFSDGWNTGFGGYLGLLAPVSSGFGFYIGAEYRSFGLDDDALKDEVYRIVPGTYSLEISGGSANIIDVYATLAPIFVGAGSSTWGYLYAGGGASNLAVTDATVKATAESQSASGTIAGTDEWNAMILGGAGVVFDIVQLSGSVSHIFTEEGVTTASVKVGVVLGGRK